MKTGRIKWYDCFQNHGYIILYDGTEVYFHSTSVRDASWINHLSPGIDVSFDLIVTKGGMEAQNIDLVGLERVG
jgi:cold shock CspA family protein